MKKMITFNDDQAALLERLMKENYQTSVSAFFAQLLNEKDKGITTTIKRPPGRPRKEEEEDEDARIYCAPAGEVQSVNNLYTKAEIIDYWDWRNKPVPPDGFKVFKAE